MDNNMKSFIKKYSKDADYVGLKIGDTIRYNEQTILVTNIVKVFVENDYVYVEGYGMLVEY